MLRVVCSSLRSWVGLIHRFRLFRGICVKEDWTWAKTVGHLTLEYYAVTRVPHELLSEPGCKLFSQQLHTHVLRLVNKQRPGVQRYDLRSP